MPQSVVYRQSNNGLKIEAVRPFEMAIAIYLSTRHRVPKTRIFTDGAAKVAW